MHFTTCTQLRQRSCIIEARKQLRDFLSKENVYDGIIDLLVYTLNGGDIDKYNHIPRAQSLQHLWTTAWTGQKKVGWTGFLQGMWHEGWFQLQQQHACLGRTQYDTSTSAPRLISQIIAFAYTCWKERNQALHGTTTDAETRQRLQATVQRLYSDPDRFLFSTKEKRRLFHIPVTKKITHSNATLESWIDVVETRLRLDRETHAKMTIKRWIDSRNRAP